MLALLRGCSYKSVAHDNTVCVAAGRCVCEPGFGGEDCSEHLFECTNNCSGHGECRCMCCCLACPRRPPSCEWLPEVVRLSLLLPLAGCLFLGRYGACACYPNFKGEDCSIELACPSGCSNQGAEAAPAQAITALDGAHSGKQKACVTRAIARRHSSYLCRVIAHQEYATMASASAWKGGVEATVRHAHRVPTSKRMPAYCTTPGRQACPSMLCFHGVDYDLSRFND